eukprot:403357406
MACFGGPAYQDIAIDSQLFLPIQMRLAGRNLTFLTTNDRIYDQIVPPKNQQQEEEKKQQNPVEQQKMQQMQKQLELQAEKMKQEIVAKEQKLDDSRKEIKHLNNQIELLNELLLNRSINSTLNRLTLINQTIPRINKPILIKNLKIMDFQQIYHFRSHSRLTSNLLTK